MKSARVPALPQSRLHERRTRRFKPETTLGKLSLSFTHSDHIFPKLSTSSSAPIAGMTSTATIDFPWTPQGTRQGTSFIKRSTSFPGNSVTLHHYYGRGLSRDQTLSSWQTLQRAGDAAFSPHRELTAYVGNECCVSVGISVCSHHRFGDRLASGPIARHRRWLRPRGDHQYSSLGFRNCP